MFQWALLQTVHFEESIYKKRETERERETERQRETEFIGSPCKGEIIKWCSSHLVLHFEECSPDVTVNCEFNV
jgi:hypothetical protein